MASPLLLLLLASASFHAYMAIKCVIHPDPEKGKLWNETWHKERNEDGPRDLEKEKQDLIQMLNTSAKADCTEEGQGKGVKEITHCFSIDLGSCSEVPYPYDWFGLSQQDLAGIFQKKCLSTEQMGDEIIPQNATMSAIKPEDFCGIVNENNTCGCYVCNDRDYCNEGPVKTDQPIVPNGKIPGSGAALIGVAPALLFLLLLAIAFGTFR